ncbi:MAG: MotA/TolQ/ExbB proton channel family protein [Firmicutes bacterium]|nr:MotA/TolQ/ExbB proton channel family protein [Bacillota bacterium]
MGILRIFAESFLKFDFLIFLAAGANLYVFLQVQKYTDLLYGHFNPIDRESRLPKLGQKKIHAHTAGDVTLKTAELLEARVKMNQAYGMFTNITAIFPLLGMLGTVWSLIPMVSMIGDIDIGRFFTALTSTVWGIVFAIIYKMVDARINYKIEDNEKHCDHLLFPSEDE